MKEYEVTITKRALQDMEAIYQYIAVNLSAPATAMKQYNRIAQGIESLNLFPERYPLMRSEPEKRKGIRRVLIDNYSAFYFVNQDKVTVFRVLYSASDITDKLLELP